MQDVDDEPLGVARVDFTEDEERGLGRLASTLQLVGLLQIVLAGLAFVLASIGVLLGAWSLSPLFLLITGLGLAYVGLPIWQGVMLRESGELLGRVAGSDDDDQEHLASAFRRLRVVFMIELGLGLWQAVRTWM